jgi:hypothetical protein
MCYSGTKFDLINPSYEQILLTDVAHALSMNCRYTGHTKWFYSVAQHCILGAQKMEEDGLSFRLQLLFMLHDATETWYNDISRPLKPLLTNYQELEDKAALEVWKAFALPEPTEEEWAIVKYYDNLMLSNEIPKLMRNPEEFGVELRYDDIDFKEYLPSQIERMFKNITIGLLMNLGLRGELLVK